MMETHLQNMETRFQLTARAGVIRSQFENYGHENFMKKLRFLLTISSFVAQNFAFFGIN